MAEKLSKILVLAVAIVLVQYIYPSIFENATAMAGIEVVGE